MEEDHAKGHTATASGSITACAECSPSSPPKRPLAIGNAPPPKQRKCRPSPRTSAAEAAMQPRSLSDAVGFLRISPKQEAVLRGCIEKLELAGCAP